MSIYGRKKTKQNKKTSHFQQLRMALCNFKELKKLVYMYNATIRTLLKFPSHHLFYNRAICFSEPHKTFRFVSKSGIGKSQLCIPLLLAKMYQKCTINIRNKEKKEISRRHIRNFRGILEQVWSSYDHSWLLESDLTLYLLLSISLANSQGIIYGIFDKNAIRFVK